MHTASTTAPGIKPGGLASSKWASTTSPAWSSRGTPTYTPRGSSSSSRNNSSSAVGPRATSVITPATQWWETPNPAPKLRDPAAATSAAAPSTATPAAAAPTTAPPPPAVGRPGGAPPLRPDRCAAWRWKAALPCGTGYRPAPLNPRGRRPSPCSKPRTFNKYYMPPSNAALVHLSRAAPAAGAKRHAPATPETCSPAHERADNSLRAALGTGDVRVFLGRAKELRNRWKYAEGDEPSTAQQPPLLKGPTRGSITGRAPLESYDLDSMFGHIFGGFDQGYGIAEAWVAELASRADMVPAAAADGAAGADMAIDDDEEFDFMVDAMDWEAV
ncbi:conserved hypothetical protein [Verticillium alfalfae VaMs.102]|uniref:Uncharacterized protein n=1 Tax=Verticillium alfalfae (strain VaMs.102 / ATCC MYA-4576 / FGSC 10136) TaxID=526221 RepID=C9SX85_VERA1|nr:conserved hypothetical protein [Verticillium alfalfae VaMs.102]EEY23275.1 conserved hypothetical protein [Verticillium alfalfae VaMs.102]